MLLSKITSRIKKEHLPVSNERRDCSMADLISKYRWPLLFALAGLLIAILLMTVGFFKTLLILLFTCLGAVIGYYVEQTGLLENVFSSKK